MWDDLCRREVKVWGGLSWDARSWEVGEAFARKWWWLMDENLLSVLNFWRGLRGEGELSLSGIRLGGMGKVWEV